VSLRPFYRSSDDRIAIYHAPWEVVLGGGLLPVSEIALIHADPTYGNGDATRPKRNEGVRRNTAGTRRRGAENGKARTWAPLEGNDRPFDPAPLLALDRPLVTWGANHYSSRLPDSAAWIVWDKRDGTTPDDGADAELAWTNLGGTARTFRHVWRGLARASETGRPHLWPCQKPVALSRYIFEWAKLRRGELVFVPYMGSGPDIAAALGMGLRIIACDVSEEACHIAVDERIGPLFATERAAAP